MLFGSSTTKIERLRAAEERLLAIASRFGGCDNDDCYQINVFDTFIPRSVVPLATHAQDQVNLGTDDDKFVIHGVRVTSTSPTTNEGTEEQETPLVMLHGYMNGAAYFYRNFAGLSRAFKAIYSLDLLGWGLSSRPAFEFEDPPQDHSTDPEKMEEHEIRAAEDFFVESLEAWRKANQIPKMIVCGHSMGGYISVAYSERYPQHVERLILVSPAGVPSKISPSLMERYTKLREQSLLFRMLNNTWFLLYERNTTAGSIVRWMPEVGAKRGAMKYVQRRLPALAEDREEQQALAEYLALSNRLPGSGEYCVSAFLTNMMQGKRPTETRIPQLQVPKVSFLYGSRDWMDVNGGLRVQTECSSSNTPDVGVYRVQDAGHLLMLDNWREFCAGVIHGAGRTVPEDFSVPLQLDPSVELANGGESAVVEEENF